MTGRFAGSFSTPDNLVRENHASMRISNIPSEAQKTHLAAWLKQAGYELAYGGKIHLPRPLNPQTLGFNYIEKDQRKKLAEACADFIKKPHQRPYFLWANFINPHDICFAHLARNGTDRQNVLALHRQACSLAPDKLPPLPENYGIPQNEPAAIEANLSPKAVTPAITMRKEYDERAWRINRWIYHRLTEKVDRHIGKILDGLRNAGLADNTLIIFTSDHGNMDASHRLASKGLMYEESVGVPLLIKYKGAIAAGKTDRTHLVSTGLDILPTICDYAGVRKPGHLLGRSLRPLAEGKRVRQWRRYVASENGWSRMIRTPRYKYCAYSAAYGNESLVDMENDPGEMRNLVDVPQFRDVLSEHRKLLAEWVEISKDGKGSQYLKNG